jgi:hypothetical protein
VIALITLPGRAARLYKSASAEIVLHFQLAGDLNGVASSCEQQRRVMDP